jgi:hypothetical protein
LEQERDIMEDNDRKEQERLRKAEYRAKQKAIKEQSY